MTEEKLANTYFCIKRDWLEKETGILGCSRLIVASIVLSIDRFRVVKKGIKSRNQKSGI